MADAKSIGGKLDLIQKLIAAQKQAQQGSIAAVDATALEKKADDILADLGNTGGGNTP